MALPPLGKTPRGGGVICGKSVFYEFDLKDPGAVAAGWLDYLDLLGIAGSVGDCPGVFNGSKAVDRRIIAGKVDVCSGSGSIDKDAEFAVAGFRYRLANRCSYIQGAALFGVEEEVCCASSVGKRMVINLVGGRLFLVALDSFAVRRQVKYVVL